MTTRERLILQILDADPKTLRGVQRVLARRKAKRHPVRRAACDSSITPIAFGMWKDRLPTDTSSVDWVNRLRSAPRCQR
jgi:hypothetical protein